MKFRQVKKVFESKPVLEGAGVRLRRAFGYYETPMFDPFLLLDDFRSGNPEDYVKGFPWHPHRGIETITYVLRGTVEHKDSMDNSGVISAGDIQWMTAGSGIIHQEMPKGNQTGEMYGFQLWANIPAERKMMDPRYQELKSSGIPEVRRDDGVTVRIICGTFEEVKGPVKDLLIDPEYFDVRIPSNGTITIPSADEYNAFIYVFEGSGVFSKEPEVSADNHTLLLFSEGDAVRVRAGKSGVRFLFIAGRPLGEPVAWRGPIVMNTEAELQTAFREYQNGTFIKT